MKHRLGLSNGNLVQRRSGWDEGSRFTLAANSFMILPKCAAVQEWMYGKSIGLRSLGSTVRFTTCGVGSFRPGSVSVFCRCMTILKFRHFTP